MCVGRVALEPGSARQEPAPTRSELAAAAVALASLGGAVDDLELLQAAARSHGDAGERGFGELNRHLGLFAEPLLEPGEEGAAACEDDPAVHDVRRQLGGRLVQGGLDRVEDLADR